MNQYYLSEKAQLIRSGHPFFQTLVQLIEQSTHTIHFQTYILASDETARTVLSALRSAAKRGVKVYLLADAFGSFNFPADLSQELLNDGIHFRLYSPLFSTESILPWRRLHHKLFVCDNKTALIGGINIADKYNSLPGSPAWLDYAVLINGSVCASLATLCESIYFKRKINPLASTIPSEKPELTAVAKNQIRFRRNDWIKNKNEIHKSYTEAIKQAQSSITIVASYFLPGANFRKLLREASQRGVKIKLIMAGKSDSYSVKLAENYLYDFYIRYHIELYEWKESVLHGKVMLVDEKWATIGSYNLNFLSHYISIELNADIISPEFCHQLSNDFSAITQDYSKTFQLSPSKHYNSFFRKILLWLAYNFFRLMMTIFVSGKRKNKKK